MAKKSGAIVTAQTVRPQVWTGDVLLDYMLAEAGFTSDDLRDAMRVTREALRADAKDGGADHALRLRAAENLMEWVGFRGKRQRDEGGHGDRPIAVALNLTVIAPVPRADPQPGLPPRGVTVHLALDGPAGGNGHGPAPG